MLVKEMTQSRRSVPGRSLYSSAQRCPYEMEA